MKIRRSLVGLATAAVAFATVQVSAQSEWSLRRGAPEGAEIVEVDLSYAAGVGLQVVGVIVILVLAYLLVRGWNQRAPARGEK